MKHILVSTFLVSVLSVWSVAQRPQTNVGVVRPVTQVEVVRPQTSVSVTRPVTTVEVVHPQTTVEVLHPQTPTTSAGATEGTISSLSSKQGGKSSATTSAKASTSMSDFKPKQAKDFAVGQKAAPIGGGDNKLGNATNEAEKDAANKASMLGKQGNQNIDVDLKAKAGNLASLDSKIEKKTNEKSKK